MAATRQARKSPARKATPRKAAPKKAAATRADDAANGEAVEAAASSLGNNGQAPDNGAQVNGQPAMAATVAGDMSSTANKAVNLVGEVDNPYVVRDGDGNPVLSEATDDEPAKPIPLSEDLLLIWPMRDGSPPIVVPSMLTLPITRKFLWSIRKKSDLVQGWEWMDLAKVPDYIQERIVDLSDQDYEAFWTQWFQTLVPGPGGLTPSPAGPPGE